MTLAEALSKRLSEDSTDTLFVRCLALVEAVEELPEPKVTVHSYLDGVMCSHSYADPALATAVEKLKELCK